MKNKLIIRLSNNLGNQMFMYASGFAIAKELNRELFIDNETAYKSKNNFHIYNLDIFKFSAQIAPAELKYNGFTGYIKRKMLKNLDKVRSKKDFYVEKKDKNKITFFSKDFLNENFKQNLFLEGHFESEKYFDKYKNDIKKEFLFKENESFKNVEIYNKIKDSNSVSLCLRQHRFSERKRDITIQDREDSEQFSLEQAKYVAKAIKIFKGKISNPKFFLWSNDYKNISKYLPNEDFTIVSTNSVDSDLFLMTQAKHFIVIPSSYNWWGCWLSQNPEKIVFRPSEKLFSKYKVNNRDFWPSNWNVID